MRREAMMLLCGLLALSAPAAVEAKSYHGEGYKAKHRSVSSTKQGYKHKAKKHAKRRGGGASASASCLTSEARNLLGRIRSRFGNVQIISTCRPGARIATTGKISKHASGQAIDFRVPGRKREVVQWLKANHRSGGTMTYSDMDHIHVDVGYRFVALNRPSGRG